MHTTQTIRNTARRTGIARLALKALTGGALFAAGYVAAVAAAPYATSINVGLVNAFDAVGKNLFGNAVFSAIPPNPAVPGNPVRIDIAADSRIATSLGVFIPPNPIIPGDPCRRAAQLVFKPATFGDGVLLPPSATLYYDSSLAGLSVQVFQQTPPDPVAPALARCPGATTSN